MSELAPSRIVCAAIRNCRGDIICGARHYDSVMRAQIKRSKSPRYWKMYVRVFGIYIKRYPRVEQGFIDQFGTYFNREDALKIAINMNQIRRICGNNNSKELFSENLY